MKNRRTKSLLCLSATICISLFFAANHIFAQECMNNINSDHCCTNGPLSCDILPSCADGCCDDSYIGACFREDKLIEGNSTCSQFPPYGSVMSQAWTHFKSEGSGEPVTCWSSDPSCEELTNVYPEAGVTFGCDRFLCY